MSEIGQAVALIGSLLFIGSCFSIVRRRILVLGLLSSALFIIAYLIRGDATASFLVCIALARNGFYMMAGTSTIARRYGWLGLTAIACVGWILTAPWGNLSWWSPLPLIASVSALYAFSLHSVAALKVIQVVNGLLWLTYELLSGAYTVMIGEGFGLTLAALALYRLTLRRPHPGLIPQ